MRKKKTYLLLLLLLLLIVHDELSQRLHDTPFLLLADIADLDCLACSHDGMDCVPTLYRSLSFLNANLFECSGGTAGLGSPRSHADSPHRRWQGPTMGNSVLFVVVVVVVVVVHSCCCGGGVPGRDEATKVLVHIG